jgi:hypothetical protein
MAAPSKTRKATSSKPKRQAAKATGSKPKQQTAKTASSKPRQRTAKTASSKPKQQAAKTASSKPKRQTAKAASAKPKQAARATGSKPKRQTAKATSSKPRQQAARATGSKRQTGIYVYGILPADTELTSEMPGVGDPPGQVRVVYSDGLAALVSEVDATQPLGSPEDLRAHKEILDASVTELPVLPLRFGAVLAGEDEVAEELLAANRDEFAAALSKLDGRAEYVVKGRYIEDAVLDEVLSENKQAARLQGQIQGKDSDAAQDARIELGEILNEAVTAKRQQDTRALEHAMERVCVASAVREPVHRLDAVHVAFLVAADQESKVERVIEDLARDWEGWIEVRLLGPMAAYDFAGKTARRRPIHGTS